VLGREYRYVEAENGDRGLELVRELEPDLVVLDLMLPGLSGLQLLAELRQDPALAATPVVVISAWSDSGAAALEAGADHFLAKPFDADELKAIVAELLARDGRGRST
jgi:DNA-binding response OmpR family regulator